MKSGEEVVEWREEVGRGSWCKAEGRRRRRIWRASWRWDLPGVATTDQGRPVGGQSPDFKAA